MSSSTSAPTLQIATVQDAEALSTFASRSFLDAFAAQNNPDDINGYVEEAFSRRALLAELSDATNTFLIAHVDGHLTAYLKLRRGRSPACVQGHQPVEIHRLYVDKKRAPSGLGSTLLRAGLDSIPEANCDVVWLGVWSENTGAQRFYQRFGFEHVGEQSFMMGPERQTDWIMQRVLSL